MGLSSTDEYLTRLEGRLALNAGFLVGHSAIRRSVMAAAANGREASQNELAAMRSKLSEGLAEGGMGFSSTWSPAHSDMDGGPVPSRLASEAELASPRRSVATSRGPSLEFVFQAIGPFARDKVELMASMSHTAGPLNWNLLTVSEASFDEAMEKLDGGTYAGQHGGRVVALILPATAPARFSFRTGVVLDGLPGWEDLWRMPSDRLLTTLLEPAERERLEPSASRPSPLRHLADWGKYRIVETFTPKTKQVRGTGRGRYRRT